MKLTYEGKEIGEYSCRRKIKKLKRKYYYIVFYDLVSEFPNFYFRSGKMTWNLCISNDLLVSGNKFAILIKNKKNVKYYNEMIFSIRGKSHIYFPCFVFFKDKTEMAKFKLRF